MNRAIEQLLWNGRAQFKTQTFGLGTQFVLPIGEQNTGIITKIVYSPFSFQPGTGGEFITAPVQEIILSDGRRAIRKAIKNFESGLIKGDSKYISQGQSVLSQLYYPFFADAPIFINLNGNNIAFQLAAPFNQLVRDDIAPGLENILNIAKANGDALPSLDQQYWLNQLYITVAPFIAANRIFLFVNGKHDAGAVDFSLYDWAQPGLKYALNPSGSQSVFYSINTGTGGGGGSGNFGFNGFTVPANNPGWLAYKAARFPRGGFIHGNSNGTQNLEFGTNRNGAFCGGQLRGWNQTLGTQGGMNRPTTQNNCKTFAWQQNTITTEIDYYTDGAFLDTATQPANENIPVNESLIIFGRQGQQVSANNGVQFLHSGLTPGEILAINNAVKSYCANLASPAPVPTTPTGIIQAFLTVYYIEINGNVLNTL
jgi:hypothetical protein